MQNNIHVNKKLPSNEILFNIYISIFVPIIHFSVSINDIGSTPI